MNRKDKLLSIGEISKYTGASVKSLRYYERINILKPVFVDPDTDYRYYSFEQMYLVEIIILCIELDIPLKELSRFIEENKTIDYLSLLHYGKRIAEEKVKTLQRGLKFIGNVEQRIAAVEKYHKDEQIYSRDINEKYYYVMPYDKPSFDDADAHEKYSAYTDYDYNDDDYYARLPECGFLCVFSPGKTERFIFIELPKRKAKANIKTIPVGTYFCMQSEDSQIEKAPQIFNEYLQGKDSFLIIETEIFARKYEINKPLNELRLIIF
jgi:DNA-binding transcriptional MerR regulator